MSGNGSGQSSRGVWMVALVALGLLAMVAWDQLHVRSAGRPAPVAGSLVGTPAPSPADTAATPPPRALPETTPAAEPAGESESDNSADGRHAI